MGAHIAIIGGGPSGLIASEILASAGHRVTIYDRMPSLGRKLLMAGRGGLNLTHSEPLETFITRYREAAGWLTPSILAFPPDALRAWCEGLGESTFIGSSGRVFPRSMKAAPLLRAWLKRLETLGVQYAARHEWTGWDKQALTFSNGATVTPDATLLALGGASWPRLGSDGGWVNILLQHGVGIAPLKPSNCGFTVEWSDYFRSRFAGMPLKPVILTHNGMSQQGEMIVTTQGMEGGAVYALSASLRDAITSYGKTTLHLDLRPGMSQQALTHKLQAPRGNQSLSTYLRKVGFSPLTVALLREVATPASSPEALAKQLKALPLTVTATNGIARAISTAGGIARHALTDSFMLTAKPGVFATGEMLDWEAPTGGYLLQACFSTGVAAARGIEKFLGDMPGAKSNIVAD